MLLILCNNAGLSAAGTTQQVSGFATAEQFEAAFGEVLDFSGEPAVDGGISHQLIVSHFIDFCFRDFPSPEIGGGVVTGRASNVNISWGACLALVSLSSGYRPSSGDTVRAGTGPVINKGLVRV